MRQLFTILFLRNKDEDRPSRRKLDDVAQEPRPFESTKPENPNKLLHIFRSLANISLDDLDRIRECVSGKFLDPLFEGGAEQRALTIRPDVITN